MHYQDTTHDWRTLKGDLMTVHWYEGGQAFANKALRIGEQAIKDTSTLLGVDETEPVDFYIYGDEASFRTALGPGTRENVGGQAHADIRTLFALITPDEIDDVVGRRRHPPRARAPRVRHRRAQPVPVPAPLAQRGPRRLPVRGLRVVRSGPGARTP